MYLKNSILCFLIWIRDGFCDSVTSFYSRIKVCFSLLFVRRAYTKILCRIYCSDEWRIFGKDVLQGQNLRKQGVGWKIYDLFMWRYVLLLRWFRCLPICWFDVTFSSFYEQRRDKIFSRGYMHVLLLLVNCICSDFQIFSMEIERFQLHMLTFGAS